eukprot:GILI01010209.1.p2 GENE.GILI01010209.1~~GILI01010209.1.p2  ORF type:complete len:402 (-),score=108.60 GILI01010209.1:234-1439(-)
MMHVLSHMHRGARTSAMPSLASQAVASASLSAAKRTYSSDVKRGNLIVLDFNDLLRGKDLSQDIHNAYGLEGLGILAVRNIPNYIEYRSNLLPLASTFAHLPESIKQKYVHESSHYSFGWSHGKERLEGGRLDLAKGSYYGNPQFDNPTKDQKLIQQFPEYCHPNIWPTEDLPQLESAFKNLGQLIVRVGSMVASQCDRLVASAVPSWPTGKLQRTIDTSRTCKARLLHYFATDKPGFNNSEDMSSWCGWHNDHGSLTGLTPAMYYNDRTQSEVACPDPRAGLYIRSRSGEVVRISVSSDLLAFQIGESAQIHSGGILRATPHCVRAAEGPAAVGISRNTYAVFMQPTWNESMNVPAGVNPSKAHTGANDLPAGVPSIQCRWDPTMDFSAFTKATLDKYYS